MRIATDLFSVALLRVVESEDRVLTGLNRMQRVDLIDRVVPVQAHRVQVLHLARPSVVELVGRRGEGRVVVLPLLLEGGEFPPASLARLGHLITVSAVHCEQIAPSMQRL